MIREQQDRQKDTQRLLDETLQKLEGLRVDLRQTGVDVTVVHPGFVRTPMTQGAKNPQPFMMDVEPAVRIMVRGILARRRTINFPWPTVALLRFAQLLPGPVYDRLAAALLLGGPPKRAARRWG